MMCSSPSGRWSSRGRSTNVLPYWSSKGLSIPAFWNRPRANRRDKFRRGFRNLIDVWGADHSGHVKRMQAAVRAVTSGAASLDLKIYQFVNLFDKGVPVRMSKRAGTFVTLREVVDGVGKDVFRFIMLTRRNDQTLEFDFAKVTEQSKDNPVFYVQYAHARAASVMRHAIEQFPEYDLSDAALAGAPLDR